MLSVTLPVKVRGKDAMISTLSDLGAQLPTGILAYFSTCQDWKRNRSGSVIETETFEELAGCIMGMVQSTRQHGIPQI